jgi:hypothetical protein
MVLNPEDPRQRSRVVQELGSFSTKVKLKAVVHGTLTKDGPPATLIVLQFSFSGARANRRVRQARISLQFGSDPKVPGASPELVNISPKGENETKLHSVCPYARGILHVF